MSVHRKDLMGVSRAIRVGGMLKYGLETYSGRTRFMHDQ